jgi:hypothetical protein
MLSAQNSELPQRAGIVPNRLPLTAISRPNGQISISCVLVNWAGLVALWALPYLTLLDHFRVDAAHSEILQWSLLVIGALGLVSILYTAWRETLNPAWRAQHGRSIRTRSDRPHTGNAA